MIDIEFSITKLTFTLLFVLIRSIEFLFFIFKSKLIYNRCMSIIELIYGLVLLLNLIVLVPYKFSYYFFMCLKFLKKIICKYGSWTYVLNIIIYIFT